MFQTLKHTTLLLLLGLIVFSCDIPGLLNIINRTERPITYKIERIVGDSIRVSSVDIPPGEELLQIFNFGEWWTDEMIEEYLSSYKSIEITSASDTIRLSNPEQMKIFFQQHRRGLLKANIRIKIKE